MLTEEQKATNYDTFRHIERVRNLLNRVAMKLLERGELHDQSKLVSPEVEAFTEYTGRLATTTYGSPEYDACKAAMRPALEHHYANNRHHPEFNRKNEEWRPIIGFEQSYEVSSFGDIRSITRLIERPNGNGSFLKESNLLKQYITPKGYLRLQLQYNGKCKNLMVHRIVAEAFLENKELKPEVNHIDGNKTNNKINNLEWVTSSENQQHAYENYLKKPAIKYVVECPQLDLTSFGCLEMEKMVRSVGYEKVTAAGIWSSINNGGKHFDLEFIGSNFETWMNSPINDMNLLDLLEMMIDWKAASERHNDGNIRKSIEINGKRFEMSPQLIRIFENTVDALF